MKAVIIAAGEGSRLQEATGRGPKTLLPFGDGTILSHIMLNFRTAGISEFIIVIGFGAQAIRQYIAQQQQLGSGITLVENHEWQRGNCLSVCRARPLLGPDEPCLLSMSDHLVTPDALRRMRLERSDRSLLLVDPDCDAVYDIEDATKVSCENGRIVAIGKELSAFNAIDCGIFRLSPDFFETAEQQIALHRESVSDTVKALVARDQIWPVVIPKGSGWVDIDTPGAYARALSQQETFRQALAQEANS